MNQTEFDAYRAETHTPVKATVSVDEVPGPDRTLVYGYQRFYDQQWTETTHTVHVYKADGMLHTVVYKRGGEQVSAFSGTEILVEDCVPGKRAYPERCDLGFARLLRDREHPLTFTNWGGAGANSEGTFAGLRIEETTQPAFRR